MRFVVLVAGLAIGAALLPRAALSQTALPAIPYYAIPPGTGPSAPPTSPVQQQILENYRTQLLQSQRELQQASPGLSRDQIDIGGRLNAIGSAPVGGPVPPGPVVAPVPLLPNPVAR